MTNEDVNKEYDNIWTFIAEQSDRGVDLKNLEYHLGISERSLNTLLKKMLSINLIKQENDLFFIEKEINKTLLKYAIFTLNINVLNIEKHLNVNVDELM